MFVMKFGVGYYDPINDRWVEGEIPNEAITSNDGFPGAGMPNLWLLSADEGDTVIMDTGPDPDDPDLIGKVVNFLNGYAHLREVYAAVVIPSDVDDEEDIRGAYGVTYGPIWGRDPQLGHRLPVIAIDLENIDEGMGLPCGDCNQANNRATCWWCEDVQQPFRHCGHCHTFLYCADCDNDNLADEQQCGECGWNIHGLAYLQVLTWVVGHELGHTVLWHQPGGGHHADGTNYDCLIWQWLDWRVNPPTEFCAQNPGCQTRWKLNP